MKKNAIHCLLASLTLIAACTRQKPLPVSENNRLQEKIDWAVLSMYKIYSKCTTAIFLKNGDNIDTIEKNKSYLCLSANVVDTEIKADSVIVTIFFQPDVGFLMEDPTCEFAYSLGFVGNDNQWDFIMFGDNYYSMPYNKYLEENPDIDSVFNAKIKTIGCVNPQLQKLLDGMKQ